MQNELLPVGSLIMRLQQQQQSREARSLLSAFDGSMLQKLICRLGKHARRSHSPDAPVPRCLTVSRRWWRRLLAATITAAAHADAEATDIVPCCHHTCAHRTTSGLRGSHVDSHAV